MQSPEHSRHARKLQDADRVRFRSICSKRMVAALYDGRRTKSFLCTSFTSALIGKQLFKVQMHRIYNFSGKARNVVGNYK